MKQKPTLRASLHSQSLYRDTDQTIFGSGSLTFDDDGNDGQWSLLSTTDILIPLVESPEASVSGPQVLVCETPTKRQRTRKKD